MNNKYTCCVVIPIYKKKLNEFEILSLKQCCKILNKYPIFFVTHKQLDCSMYNSICDEFKITYAYCYFNKVFFSNISGYNALTLSKLFYKKFIDYEYMLVYQLDAYVFSDDLMSWCNKGYDFVGAPWLELNEKSGLPDFSFPLAVCNGGFCLRKIEKFINIHNASISMKRFTHLIQSFSNNCSKKLKSNILYVFPKIMVCFILLILKPLFHKNIYEINEDKIWSMFLHEKGNLPAPGEAMKFSFEAYPEYLFAKNGNVLPFGCHGWYNSDNYGFYKNFIP